MIYSRWGGRVRLVRFATAADHKTACEWPMDRHDRQRMADGCRVVFAYDGDGTPENPKDDGKIRVADTGYLRADGGLTEILDAVRVLRNVAPMPQASPAKE